MYIVKKRVREVGEDGMDEIKGKRNRETKVKRGEK